MFDMELLYTELWKLYTVIAAAFAVHLSKLYDCSKDMETPSTTRAASEVKRNATP
jgi:hypothetical protein